MPNRNLNHIFSKAHFVQIGAAKTNFFTQNSTSLLRAILSLIIMQHSHSKQSVVLSESWGK